MLVSVGSIVDPLNNMSSIIIGSGGGLGACGVPF